MQSLNFIRVLVDKSQVKRLEESLDWVMRRADAFLLLLCALGFALVLALLLSEKSFVLDYYAEAPRAQSAPLAQVQFVRSEAKLRSAQLPVWKKLQGSEKLYAKDQVFTDSNSDARLLFRDGSRLELGENSLVVVQETDRGTELNLLRGVVTGQLGAEAEHLHIKVGSAELGRAQKGTRLQIRARRNGTADFLVIEGRAHLSNAQQALDLGAHESSGLLDNARLEQPSVVTIELLSPLADSLLEKNSPSLRFEWRKLAAVGGSYRFELSHDRDFQKILETQSGSDAFHQSGPLEAGIYFWRVGLVNPLTGEARFGEHRRFEVRKRMPPELLAPLQGEPFYLESTVATDVHFFWKEKLEGERLFQLARDEAFTQMVAQQHLQTNDLLVSHLREGNYFWRVSQAGELSRPRSFSVSAVPLPQNPRALSPLPEQNFSLPDKIDLRWERVVEAKGYRLQISTDPNFAQLLEDRELKSPQFSYQPSRAALYYWRLQALDARNRPTPFGEARAFRVEENSPPPKRRPAAPVLEPKYELELEPPQSSLPRPDTTLDKFCSWLLPSAWAEESVLRAPRLRWPKSEGAHRYLLELARDRDFRETLVREELAENDFLWKSASPGHYYFRVAVRDIDGNLSEFSNVAELEVRRPRVEMAKGPESIPARAAPPLVRQPAALPVVRKPQPAPQPAAAPSQEVALGIGWGNGGLEAQAAYRHSAFAEASWEILGRIERASLLTAQADDLEERSLAYSLYRAGLGMVSPLYRDQGFMLQGKLTYIFANNVRPSADLGAIASFLSQRVEAQLEARWLLSPSLTAALSFNDQLLLKSAGLDVSSFRFFEAQVEVLRALSKSSQLGLALGLSQMRYDYRDPGADLEGSFSHPRGYARATFAWRF